MKCRIVKITYSKEDLAYFDFWPSTVKASQIYIVWIGVPCNWCFLFHYYLQLLEEFRLAPISFNAMIYLVNICKKFGHKLLRSGDHHLLGSIFTLQLHGILWKLHESANICRIFLHNNLVPVRIYHQFMSGGGLNIFKCPSRLFRHISYKH